MAIKRGFVAGLDGQIKTAWLWATTDPPSPYPDNLTLDPGDVMIEDADSSADDWQAFQRDLAAYYVAAGVRVAKTAMSLTVSPATIPADATTAAVISGIPAGATVTLGTTSQLADGTDVSFTTDLPGDYVVLVSHPQHLSAQVAIHAT